MELVCAGCGLIYLNRAYIQEVHKTRSNTVITLFLFKSIVLVNKHHRRHTRVLLTQLKGAVYDPLTTRLFYFIIDVHVCMIRLGSAYEYSKYSCTCLL